MAARRVYPKGYFLTIKDDVVKAIENRRPIRLISSDYGMNPSTLARMMQAYEVSAVRVRHLHEKRVALGGVT